MWVSLSFRNKLEFCHVLCCFFFSWKTTLNLPQSPCCGTVFRSFKWDPLNSLWCFLWWKKNYINKESVIFWSVNSTILWKVILQDMFWSLSLIYPRTWALLSFKGSFLLSILWNRFFSRPLFNLVVIEIPPVQVYDSTFEVTNK